MKDTILLPLNDHNINLIVQGIHDKGLTTFEQAGFKKQMENITIHDLDIWLEQCKNQSIEPRKVVVHDTNLNYNGVNKQYPFTSVYLPIDILRVNSMLTECKDKEPFVHFNFMAGNYHNSRYMLLQLLWKQGLIPNDDVVFWSSYRSPDDHSRLIFDKEFLDFMDNNTPRIFSESIFYSDLEEAEKLRGPLANPNQGWVPDLNNKDQWIYENSLISIVIDTFAGNQLKIEMKEFHSNMNTTPKTFKAIKQKRPFILTMGQTGNDLTYLKLLGFKTFDSVWDESYDCLTGIERLDAISKLCYNLSRRDITELYNQTREICEHNYNVLTQTNWLDWYLDELDTQYGRI